MYPTRLTDSRPLTTLACAGVLDAQPEILEITKDNAGNSEVKIVTVSGRKFLTALDI